MKIYNEVITRFNDLTGKWETISEDSYEYSGPMSLAQGGVPPNSTAIAIADSVKDTIKKTTGYFTNGDGTLEGSTLFTGSTSATNEKYYFTANNLISTDTNSETQFSVTFGHADGSGSDTYGDATGNANTLNGETQVIYQQLSHILQEENEASGGFKISCNPALGKPSSAVLGTNVRDDYVYALVGKRARFKDRMNKKAWTLHLSGSNWRHQGVKLQLTDDSKDIPAVSTPAGPRHNIISGTLGVAATSQGASVRTYGYFYPDRGIMLFSGPELSASMPGPKHRWTTARHITGSVAGGHYGINLNSSHISASSVNNITASINAVIPGTFTSGYEQETSFTGSHLILNIFSGSGADTAGQPTHLGYCVVDTVYSGSNIISCSNSDFPSSKATAKNQTISMSVGIIQNSTASFSTTAGTRHSSSGFAPNLYGRGNPKNALRLINCMKNVNGTTLRLRGEEDATEEHYFCRINASDYNFSANPTFVSGSKNKIANQDMWGNPNTFITGIGLFNSAGQLLAVSELSKPLKKNFASEATIKVKLTY
jgi:hypothetical protein